jgi:hypothetical protein
VLSAALGLKCCGVAAVDDCGLSVKDPGLNFAGVFTKTVPCRGTGYSQKTSANVYSKNYAEYEQELIIG